MLIVCARLDTNQNLEFQPERFDVLDAKGV